jgi:hypothetical protein
LIRRQILLTERQARLLKTLAAREGTSMAELIRRAVDRMLDAEGIADPEEVKQRALSAFGRFSDTATDVARNHDKYIAEAILEDHRRQDE